MLPLVLTISAARTEIYDQSEPCLHPFLSVLPRLPRRPRAKRPPGKNRFRPVLKLGAGQKMRIVRKLQHKSFCGAVSASACAIYGQDDVQDYQDKEEKQNTLGKMKVWRIPVLDGLAANENARTKKKQIKRPEAREGNRSPQPVAEYHLGLTTR